MTDSHVSTRRVALLAPLRPELTALVRAGRLIRTSGDAIFSHTGTAGGWTVMAGVIGLGPSQAGRATERVLTRGPFDHVIVVGVAGGLDPTLPVGALLVPSVVRLYPDGPVYRSRPLSARVAAGALMTSDGLISDEEVWRPILESGFGAVDMEAASVAEVCERGGVAWSVYRGISDRPDEHLVDEAVLALSKPNGSADLVAVAKYLTRDPRRARVLSYLNRRLQRAAEVAAVAVFDDLVHS